MLWVKIIKKKTTRYRWNAELPLFKNGKYNSESASILDCGLTPLNAQNIICNAAKLAPASAYGIYLGW